MSGEASASGGLRDMFSDISDGISSAIGDMTGGSGDAHETKEAALTQSERDILSDMAVFTRVINSSGAVTKESVTEALSAFFWQNDDLPEASCSRNFEDGYLVSLEIKADDLAAYVKDVFGAEIPSLYEEGSFAGGSIVCDGERYTFYLSDYNSSCEIVSAMEYSDNTILITTVTVHIDGEKGDTPMDMRVKRSDSPVGFTVTD